MARKGMGTEQDVTDIQGHLMDNRLGVYTNQITFVILKQYGHIVGLINLNLHAALGT